MIGKDKFASQPILSCFLDCFDSHSITSLLQANQVLLDKMHSHRESDAVIFDLDPTHAGTYGKQERYNYNAHYVPVLLDLSPVNTTSQYSQTHSSLLYNSQVHTLHPFLGRFLTS
ncbi:transposase [Oceanobacillus sp. HCA-5259]|uniref:transposase n=1 Tax=Oceanobacillus sp. HCA-5259 TaxID=3134661 RepID=UPI0040408E46